MYTYMILIVVQLQYMWRLLLLLMQKNHHCSIIPLVKDLRACHSTCIIYIDCTFFFAYIYTYITACPKFHSQFLAI